ncbi:MAG TPA: UvrD-helicase domain-containing protein [Candidatus Lachnoclostridium stercoripullorum]|uniref:ATP-dependent DNA helicase PcrA n=1 Tax=Candidatus Lachnoclostridium stercoripullorum TaxID=2838635 RepID=A0A9D1W3A6_9FIRM|nr:UvrD-helicase domain-containing protein [Candidatus Lachnoclostridium stercoripullorum]
MSIYESLNPMQREAVLSTEGPLLVLAGAGSGKTRVLTHRVAYLIEEMGVAPWNIMAITFTNKAAGEMRERVDRLVSHGAEAVWVSTFHSSCVRILRRHIQYLGFDTDFSIYDTDDQKTVMKQVIKALELDPKQYRERALLSQISAAKDQLISPEEFELNAAGDYRLRQTARIYREYQNQLKKNNALDFDDLIVKAVELLEESREVREYYQERFKYVMVDEYQDTNYAQFKLVSLLAGKYRNLCVVGDDDQSIYRFRGADIKNILSFEETFPGAKVVRLEQNYRSTGHILHAANEVIRHNEGRKEKKLWTENGEGEKVRFRQYDQAYEEADGVVKEIRDGGWDYKDCAVLYRTNAQSRLLEEKCLLYNIPYRLVGGVNFYQRREIKDILSYLKTIANGRDDLAVMRIINVPKRGIGAASVNRAEIFASANGYSMYSALARVKAIPGMGRAAGKIQEFVDLIEDFREKLSAGEYDLAGLIEDVLERSGYRASLEEEGEVEAQTRLENIEELVNKAAAYEAAAEEPSLGAFLEEVALVADVDTMEDTDDRVTLMTLHSAKGLEFDNVWMCGMEDGLFPSMMAINSEDPVSAIEEERRLCYVGITRARKRLTLTAARQRMVNGETRWHKISRFVDEIPEEELEASRLESKNFGRTISLDDGDMPWNRPARPAGVSTFGRGENAYASRTAAFSQGTAPAFGKAFTVAKADRLDYEVGDRVRHIKFGDGTVKEIKDGGKDYEVTVEFDTMGQKRMFASFAKLKKL